MNNVVNLHKWVEAKGKNMFDVASKILDPYGYMKSMASEIVEDPRFHYLDEKVKKDVGIIHEYEDPLNESCCRACIRYMESVLRRMG